MLEYIAHECNTLYNVIVQWHYYSDTITVLMLWTLLKIDEINFNELFMANLIVLQNNNLYFIKLRNN